MKKIKFFSKQLEECIKKGISVKIKAPYNSIPTIVCLKYKTYCNSKACVKDRRNI